MAMNKTEQAAQAELRRQLALAWPRFERPAPMSHMEVASAPRVTLPGDFGPRDVVLVWFVNASEGRVETGWTDGAVVGWSHNHAKNASRGFRAPYATKAQAMQAAVWQLADKCATTLREALDRLENVTP